MKKIKLEKKTKVMLQKILLNQLDLYPCLEPKDIIKALYQSEFGCGHFMSNEDNGFLRLIKEMDCVTQDDNVNNFVESIGNDFCRVHLSKINKYGLSIKTLFKLFVLSSNFKCGDRRIFEAKLDYFQELCDVNILPFNQIMVKSFISEYKKTGLHAVHHSNGFRQLYNPAYRIIRTEYCNLLPVLKKIDQLMVKKSRVIVAIEGNSSSGKTTLAKLLNEIYNCNIFHMDDFFLMPQQRTKKRLAEPGGNVDYERFYTEVMKPLLESEKFSYRPYSCSAQTLIDSVTVNSNKLNIIEGVYSMHPKLSDFYDTSIFLNIDFETQKKRILERNGKVMQKRFIEEWIPMENLYFRDLRIQELCDFILNK